MPLKDMRKCKTPATYKPATKPARQLRQAAWEGDLKTAKRLVKARADLEETDADGFTPFLIAVRWNRLEMAKVS